MEEQMKAMQSMLGGKGGDMAEQLKALMGGKGGDMAEQLKGLMGNVDKSAISESLKNVMKDGKLKEAMGQFKDVMKDPKFKDAMKDTAKQLHQYQKAAKSIGANGEALGDMGALDDHFKDLFQDADLKEAAEGFANELKEVMADGELKDGFDGIRQHMKQAKVEDDKSSLASLLMSKKSEM